MRRYAVGRAGGEEGRPQRGARIPGSAAGCGWWYARRAGVPAAALLALASLACGDEGTPPPPPVSYIVVSPEDTVVALGDSVRLTATAYGLDGVPLPRSFIWSGEPPGVARVDSLSGLVVSWGVGDYRVTAREPLGVRGFARVRVRRLVGFEPEHGAFGQVVTFRGVGFGPGSSVRFGAAKGEVRSISADGRELEAWVPWDAVTGPVEVRFADGSVVRSEGAFYVTGGGDDALEPNDLFVGTRIPIPFRNPYLLTRRENMDHVEFTLARAQPVTIRVLDRQTPISWPLHLVVQLQEPELDDFVGVSPAYSYGQDREQPGLISRARLEAGSYHARIFVFPSFIALDRRYELIVDTLPVFARAPDRFEPNDFPREAPLVAVPFDEVLAIENPWMADYYRIRLAEASEVSVQTEGGVEGGLALFFFNGPRTVHWIVSAGDFPPVYAASLFPGLFQELECVVDAGEYVVGVIENSGIAPEYRLRITAQPAPTPYRTCRQPVGASSGGAAVLRAPGVAAARAPRPR